MPSSEGGGGAGHVVIAPRAALAGDGYALPSDADGVHGATALPRVDGAEGSDVAGSADRGATQPPVSGTQPPWGWGAAPARTPPGETAAQALTDLPTNPALYTARQQDAARRDVAGRLGCYAEYSPEPFCSC